MIPSADQWRTTICLATTTRSVPERYISMLLSFSVRVLIILPRLCSRCSRPRSRSTRSITLALGAWCTEPRAISMVSRASLPMLSSRMIGLRSASRHLARSILLPQLPTTWVLRISSFVTSTMPMWRLTRPSTMACSPTISHSPLPCSTSFSTLRYIRTTMWHAAAISTYLKLRIASSSARHILCLCVPCCSRSRV